MPALVSVIIPFRDRFPLLQECIQSVFLQDYEHWELILIDDHSKEVFIPDNANITPEKLSIAKLGAKSGANCGRNLGLSLAKGEFVLFLDSDDLLASDCIKNRLNNFDHNLDLVVGKTELFHTSPGDMENRIWGGAEQINIRDALVREFVTWQTAGALYRKSFIEDIGGWNEKVVCGQDWELAARVVGRKGRCLETNHIDCYWRTSKSGSMSNNRINNIRNGAYLNTFESVTSEVKESGLFNIQRQQMLTKVFVKHMILCMHHPSNRRIAKNYANLAYKYQLIPKREFLALLGHIAFWFKLLDKNPSWSFLIRRYKIRDIHI